MSSLSVCPQRLAVVIFSMLTLYGIQDADRGDLCSVQTQDGWIM
jgi:hypothetical protein